MSTQEELFRRVVDLNRIADAHFMPIPGTLYQGAFIGNGLRVLLSLDNAGGEIWLHVSFSRERKIPDYDDVKFVKKVFVGPENQALEIHPPESQHVNDHPRCRHLWHCITNEDLVPDMRRVGPKGEMTI